MSGKTEKVRCSSCRYLKHLDDTEWVDPNAPFTWQCTHPELDGEKMSDMQKFMPRDCDKYEKA